MDMKERDLQESDVEQMVLTKVMRMNATINGIVVGLLVGCLVLISTLWLVIKGGQVVGPHLGLLGQFFFGYSVTWVGSVVGFVYGFLVGFGMGYFVSFTYNALVDLRAHWRSRFAKPLAARPGPKRGTDGSAPNLAQKTIFESTGANGKDPAQTARQKN